MRRTSPKFDIIIVGGSHTGLSLAAGLGAVGFRVLCLERSPRPKVSKVLRDGRTLALSHRSVEFLKSADVWSLLQSQTCPILDIRVADQDSSFTLDFDHTEIGTHPFGYIIENDLFKQGLEKRLRRLSNVSIIYDATVEDMAVDSVQRTIFLKDGRRFSAPLVIAADGRLSKCRSLIGIETYGWNYHQTAVVCTIAHDRPHHNVAVEHFLPGGPFATLPMTHQRSSIVWTETTKSATALMALSDKEFMGFLQEKVEPYLGNIKWLGARFSYPLTLQHAKQYTAERFVLVGDAAHGIHPIAGQGLNLGMGDIDYLVKELLSARRLGLDLGDISILRRYEKTRKIDNGNMVLMTDLLDRLFSNAHPTLQALRRFGLGTVQRWPGLRHFFMRTAMGDTPMKTKRSTTH